MSADSRAHQDLGVTGIGQDDFLTLVDEGISGVFVFLLDFSSSQSSDENGGTVPDNLHNLTRGKVTDFHLHISILIVSLPSIQSADEAHDEKSGQADETSVVNGTDHIKLSSSHVMITFIVGSVFFEPVVKVDLEVNMVTKVSWSGGSIEVNGLFGDKMTLVGFDIGSFIVLGEETKVIFGDSTEGRSSEELANHGG